MPARNSSAPLFGLRNPGLRGGGQAVGGVDAVVADVRVFTEKLVVREKLFSEVSKLGKVVLGLGRDVVVEQARFEGLKIGFAEHTVALRSKVMPVSTLNIGNTRLTRRLDWLPNEPKS